MRSAALVTSRAARGGGLAADALPRGVLPSAAAPRRPWRASGRVSAHSRRTHGSRERPATVWGRPRRKRGAAGAGAGMGAWRVAAGVHASTACRTARASRPRVHTGTVPHSAACCRGPAAARGQRGHLQPRPSHHPGLASLAGHRTLAAALPSSVGAAASGAHGAPSPSRVATACEKAGPCGVASCGVETCAAAAAAAGHSCGVGAADRCLR